MDNDIKKEIIKFTKPQWWYVLGGIIFIITGILLLIPILFTPGARRGLELDITAFIIGIVLLVRNYIIKSKTIKRLDEIENTFGSSAIKDDFLNGEKLFSDSVIMGNHFVICKGIGTIVAYEDIKKAYSKIYRHNFTEFCRQIKVVLENGKTLTVCTVLKSPNNDIYTERIFEIMEAKNPRITHEYK